MRPGGVDLRGWRITDNDFKSATDEGSLIFAADPALARVPRGTTIRIIVSQASGGNLPDDLSSWDRQMVLYVGNPHLDTLTDPGFNLGPTDNLALLAPGPTQPLGTTWASPSSPIAPPSPPPPSACSRTACCPLNRKLCK